MMYIVAAYCIRFYASLPAAGVSRNKGFIVPKHYYSLIAIFLFFLLGVSVVSASDDVEEEKKERSFFGLPFFFYSSDTGFGYGGGGMFTYRMPGAKPSNILFSVIHTTKNQFQATQKWLHNYSGGRYRFEGEFQYSKFPTDFYGLGNETLNDDPMNYTPEIAFAEVSLDRVAYRELRVKGLAFCRNLSQVERGGDYPFASLSTAMRWPNGRLDAGLGFGLVWDSRDNTTATLRGTLVKIEHRGSLVQDRGHGYSGTIAELKVFLEPLPGCVAGTNVLLRDVRGDAPFYLLPYLGGMERLRGYELQRFIGRSCALIQQDIRFPIWRMIGGCVFVASGRVGDRPGDLFEGGYHFAGGAGLRWYLNRDDGMVLRFDSAYGDNAGGTYISFGEAF